MHGSQQPTKPPAPANWLERQLVKALHDPFPDRCDAPEGIGTYMVFARAEACRLICVAAESPENDPPGFVVASITTPPVDPDEPDWQPETESTVEDSTCILANAGLLVKMVEPHGVSWRLATDAPANCVVSALADPDLQDHNGAGLAGGLTTIPEILALGSAYFTAFLEANNAVANIRVTEYHRQAMFKFDRARQPILCEILDRCGYAGRYDDATRVAA